MAVAPLASAPVLGVDCFVGDLESAAEAVIERAVSGRGGYACLANAHVLVTASRDAPLRDALDNAWVVFPDGWPVARVQKRAGTKASRVAGPDLMPLVLDLGRSSSVRHFLFGSTPTVVDRLKERFLVSTPGVSIVGSLAPPLGPFNEDEAARAIAAACPDVVWCALGAPRQETWMRRWAPVLAPAVLLGVGAAFDFLAGTKPRAPRWMQDSGLEWLHRLTHEPRRLGWRYLTTNSLFLLRTARSRQADSPG